MQFHCLLKRTCFYCFFNRSLWALKVRRGTEPAGAQGRMRVGVRVGGCVECVACVGEFVRNVSESFSSWSL